MKATQKARLKTRTTKTLDFTTETQRTLRNVFVCREVPTNKNILSRYNAVKKRATAMTPCEGIFVYR